MNNSPIDVVIPWVDGSDPQWIEEKNKYVSETYAEVATANYRFQSWDNLQYIFRGIEKFMPWVNKVFLITCGQVPNFLNLDCEKLVLVKHEDYIPKEYLPTFNSSVIELNLHRIKELSENFILFNDDLFPISSIEENYYFQDDKVCDQATETIVVPSPRTVSVYQCQSLNNLRVINSHFEKKKIIESNRSKWFNGSYSKGDLERNKNLEYWNYFTGFRTHHMAQSYKKNTFEKLWELEKETLDRTSRNKFRDYTDVTVYLARYWQLCTGNFYPRKANGKMYRIFESDINEICEFIINQMDIMISIEDVYLDGDDFDITKARINEALDKILPEKSVFEK